jgi:hypothetical protein
VGLGSERSVHKTYDLERRVPFGTSPTRTVDPLAGSATYRKQSLPSR